MNLPHFRVLPWLFVLLWSTGFIGARLGLPHAEPLSFLLIRYLAVIVFMTAVSIASGAPWPTSASAWFHIGVAGLCVHGVYLGGVFTAISKGLPAGVASLVVGVQPLLTALGAGWLLGETVIWRQWMGLFLGFLGVGFVVFDKLGSSFGVDALVPAIIALLGITAGTLYQKRFCPSFDWRTGSVAQFLPTALATGVCVALTEHFQVSWTGEFFFALSWLVLVLSVGAISLLNWLIRQGDAVNVASLFYLVPPSTALIAWLLFGESFSGIAIFGMALAIWGVYLSRK
jgi:drug/metabolite transporter (DMT)-like permease